jgi:hypothetical protein
MSFIQFVLDNDKLLFDVVVAKSIGESDGMVKF